MKKKIQHIKFLKHPFFKENSNLTLFDENSDASDIPTFFFLAGENGSGKTSILDLISSGLGKIKKGYLIHTDTEDLDVELSLLDGDEYKVMKIEVVEERIKSDIHPDGLKVLYNQVDTNFKKTKITSATAITADENEEPREESEDLSKVIPQLLVNIKAEDDAYIADYVRAHGKAPEEYVRRLDRFTNAFEKMFDGTKTFKTVSNKKGEKVIVFTDGNGSEVDMHTFSTGEKQIIFRVGHLLKDLKNLNQALILIDEPETSLHPKWQKKYVQYLSDVFKGLDIQFIIATHSPYILQGLVDGKSVCLKIDRDKGEIGEQVGFYKNMIGGGPSINLINYRVYDIVDELLHIELFAALEIKLGGYNRLKNIMNSENSIRKADTFLATIKYSGCVIGDSVSEALPISIRNKLHHADETNRPQFNENDLRESVEIMLVMLTK